MEAYGRWNSGVFPPGGAKLTAVDACGERPSLMLTWLYPDGDANMLLGIDAELPTTLAESVGRMVLVVLVPWTTLAELAVEDPSSASRRAMMV